LTITSNSETGETSEADVSTSEKKLSKKRKYQCDDGDFTTHQSHQPNSHINSFKEMAENQLKVSLKDLQDKPFSHRSFDERKFVKENRPTPNLDITSEKKERDKVYLRKFNTKTYDKIKLAHRMS